MKAIKSTKQVTKAMELVSASKMRRAQQNAQMLRRYALTAWNILEHITQAHPDIHPYAAERPPKNILAVVFTSDRGLCGSLNAVMLRTAQQYSREMKTLPGFERLDFVAIGKKAEQFLARAGHTVVAAFPAFSNHPTFKDILPVVRLLTQEFLKGTYDRVVLVYPDCVSALVQKPTAKILLPLTRTDLHDMIESLLPQRPDQKSDLSATTVKEFLFEPSPEEVLKTTIPQLTETQVFQAVLETAASEHSARMVAMRNATDNASDLLDDLTLVYNQTRQANITGELAELSASKAALEN
jgi:F-type H+-transporting ATPase subunit gamma